MDGFGDEQHTKDWSFDGVYTRYHNHSYTNGDRWSSTNTSEFSPINRPRLIKIVTFWLTLLLLGLICVSIYLANIRETKTRYYISQGKLAILQEFTTALGNKDSMEYKSLTANFCNQMDKTFRKSRSYTSSYRMCVVTNLRPGSVIVTFTLYFDATVDVSDNAVLTAINASIQQVDSKQMLGNYPIDVNELSVTTTLTLYKQDPLTFVEPNSDFIIPPTTKQTTTSTAVTSTSAIPATITTALPPVDTSETTSTTTSSIETTKVTIVIPTTETTKSTTTMPKTTTAETTTKSHTEPSTSRNTISLTSTTEPKSTPLPSTVTTTIQMTTATEGTTSSQTPPTTTITSSSLAPTVTTKPTTTIGLSTTNQHTKTTTFVPTTTTETTTSTTSPPSSTTKATTTLPFSSSTETKTTSTLSLITTVATTSLSPTTTEAKTTTTFSPSTTAKQTTSTMTPTLTSEVTITATSSPVVTSQESREGLTTKSPAKPTETTVSATFTTIKAATTISSNITSNTSTTSPVNETTGAWTTLPPTKTAEAEMSTTLPTTMTTKVVTSISSTIAGNKTTLSFQETTGTTMTMSSPKTTEGITTIPTGKTAETTMSNTLLTTKEDATISTKTTSNMSTTLPVTTEGLTSIPSTKTTEAEVSTTLPTTMTTRVVTGMSSTITGNKTTLSFKETTEKTTITMSSLETTEGVTTILTGKTAETTVSNTLAITNEDTTISTNTTSNTPTTLPVKETTESLTTIPQTKTTEAEVSTTLPITESTKVATSMSPTITGNSTTTFPLIETTGTSTSSTTLMSTESRETSTMSENITTLQSVSTSTNTDITVESTFTTFKPTSVSVENNTLSTNDTTLPPDNSAESSPDSTTTVETSLSTNDTTLPPDNSTESSPDSTTTVETSSIISHTVSNNATAEPTVLPTSDISTLISTEEATLTNTTREDMTEATATRTTSEDTTGEVTTEATTDSTTTEAVTNSIREDITTALVTNTTKEVTTELTITNTTSDYTTQVTLNTTREYTTELMVTNTTREVTTEPTFTNTTREVTTEPTFTNTTREDTTEPTFTNTTREVTTEPTVTNTTREVTTDTTVVDTSEYTSGTSTIATTMSPFTADLNFSSKKILDREDTTLECVIKVTDQWEKVTINQETENDYIFLAEFYNNGSVLSHVTSEFLSVVFKQSNETIETIIHINIQNISSCPSLLYFACGITMEDTFKSVITKTSTLSITAPLHNVTLDMATVYYSGERLELICRTITDFEYGEVALEVRSLNGLVYREPAPRTKYASTRNIDCSVEFEWRFRSSITLNSSMNGSTVRCIASNRLLNTSVSTSQLITVLVSEVSFSQYYVSGSVGKQVTIECKTNTLSSDIDKMAVYKTFNGTNETIALYSNGNTNSSSDVIVTFLDGVLTLTLSSLKCSDEGLYICVVATGSSEVASPLFLTLQPTVLAGSTVVSMSLNIDTVEHSYRHTSEHSCFGEIGYPDANGYLSLTATHPTSGKTVVYNEEDVTDAMKVKSSVGLSIYDYGVILADDFGILVREDRKVQKNCSTIHQLRFFLNVSREWSRGSFRCEIRTKEGRIPSSVKEELFYVIPSDVCDNHNKTGTFYLDHEIPDNCNTYIQCSQQPPFGEKCPNPTHCMDVQLGYCDDCNRATCREIRTTTETPTTEAVQGNGYLECNSSYVYEGESANIGCNLNTTSFVSINVTRLNSTIASILADGSVIVYPEYQGKLTAILSLASLRLSITLFSVTCSDSDTYTSKMYLRSGNVPFTTFKVVMKVKPENPSLTLHHNLMDGQNMKSHSCTGYVGNPPGFLEIQIKRSSYSNFTKYSTPLQRISSSLVDAGNCSFRQTLNFSIDLTSDSWSNVTMRCVAINQMSLEATDVVPSSFLFSVTSITRDFCKNKTADYFDYHPMGCPFYVRCYKGTPNSHECQKDLCINPTEKACV